MQPQGACAAITKSLQSEWVFSLRVIAHCGHYLENSLSSYFLPSLFGIEVSAVERQMLCLSLQFCGQGVFNPVAMFDPCYDSLFRSTLLIRESILGHDVFELDACTC